MCEIGKPLEILNVEPLNLPAPVRRETEQPVTVEVPVSETTDEPVAVTVEKL